MLAQIRTSLIREKRVHQNVFFSFCQIADFFFKLGERGSYQRTRSNIRIKHDVGFAHNTVYHLWAHGARSLSVVTADVIFHFLGNNAPALTCQNIEHGLRAYDLGKRRYQRRIANLGTNARNFFHNIVEAIDCILNFQLRHKVRHHAAGNLMRVDLHVGKRRNATLVMPALANLFPVLGNLKQQAQIKPSVVTAFLHSSDKHLDRRLGITKCQRRRSGIDNSGTSFSGFQVVGRSHTANIVAMNMNWQTDFGIECLNDALGAIRGKHARHILDGNGISAKILKLLTIFKEAVECMNWGKRIGNSAFEVAAACLNGLGVIYHVANIVQRVEHAEHVNAIAMSSSDEAVNDILGIVLVTHQVLSTGQHGKTRIGGLRLDRAQAIPRVFVEEA